MRNTFHIFYITPYSDDYKKVEEAVIGAYQKAISLVPDVNFKMTNVTNVVAGSSLTLDIVHQIQNADLVICNISKYNPNAMYELGLAHAMSKPSIILVDNETTVNFDVASLRYITYDPKSLPESLIHHLAKVLTLVVAEPDNWKFNFESNLKKELGKSKKTIFVSYSHKDTIYLERIKIHLKPLERKGVIKLWSDTLILSGEKWKEKIEVALDKAAIALLLVSADFMASEFIINNELQPILKSAESKGTIIIPIVIKPCRFLREPSISQFQAANDPTNPLCKLSEYEQEDVYEKVAHRIELAISSD